MHKFTYRRVLIFLFFVLLASILIKNSFSYLDPDLGWHLRVGGEILENRAVPETENYLYLISGKSWVDHEWLLNVISYLFFNYSTYIGLSLFFALTAVAIFILLYCYTRKYFLKHKANILVFVLFLLGVMASVPSLGVRLQEYTLLNLLVLIILLHKTSKSDNFKYLYWLPLLFLWWANIHGGYLIGFVVMFMWGAYRIIGPYISKWNKLEKFFFDKKVSKENLITMILIFLLAIIATLFTPYGLKLYTFLGGNYSDTFYFTHIIEWLPAWYYPIIVYQLFYAALATAMLVLMLVPQKGYGQQFKINIWHYGLSWFFFILAIKSRRHFPLFVVISFPLLAQFVNVYFTAGSASFKEFLKTNIFVKIYVILAIVLSILITNLQTNYTADPFINPKFCERYPCAATQFMKSDVKYLGPRIFNAYDWGGYLDYIWPQKQLFIDGRLPIYKVGQDNYSLLQEYYTFFNKDQVEEKLNEYEIELVLLRLTRAPRLSWWEKYIFGFNEENFEDINQHIVTYLDESPIWQESYNDGIAAIYVKAE
ncbi:hypothetical protein KAJ89_01925 [Candidatus Parcubacteria bacterium]|nr:hypothetical protein [Candidatus Parcubacteria bacterium]